MAEVDRAARAPEYHRAGDELLRGRTGKVSGVQGTLGDCEVTGLL